MGIVEKVKGWFTKQSPPVNVPTPNRLGNLNGLYIPNNRDIKTLGDKVNALQQAIDTLPPPTPPTDLTGYAKKNENNNFVTQNIKDNAAFLGFVKLSNNQRVGYVGKSSSTANDIELRAETNSLNLVARHNINLRPGENYFVISEKLPTANNHVANKQYVDNAVANIPVVDLSNVAKLNEANTFTEEQTFRKNVEIRNTLALGQIPYYNGPTADKDITLPLQFTTKEYVDSKKGHLRAVNLFDGGTVSTRIRKGNVGSLYFYDVDFSTTLRMDNEWSNKDVLISASLLRVYSGGKDKNFNTTVTRVTNATVNASGSVTISVSFYSVLSGVDLFVGGSGYFDGYVNINCYIQER